MVQSQRAIGTRHGRFEPAQITASNTSASTVSARCLFLQTQGYQATSLTRQQLADFMRNAALSGASADRVCVHASYNYNLAEWSPGLRDRYRRGLIAECMVAHELGIPLVNIHLGSASPTQSPSDILRCIVDGLDLLLEAVPDIFISLENSSGFAGQIASRFEEIAEVISLVKQPSRIGYALNTAHAFAAGYDYLSHAAYQCFINELDDVVGLERLRLIFMNDSKASFASRLDVHASLGQGQIGWLSLRRFVADHRLQAVPIILETPDSDLWPNEMKMIHEIERET